MNESATVVAGIVVPSTSPLFLSLVALHVIASLVCVSAGLVAMLSPKQFGRHPKFGATYYWFLVAAVCLASALSYLRWNEDRALFAIGLVSLIAATIGRTARRRRWHGWVRVHIAGMGTSYIALLVAFYVDNGKNLPLWRDLPTISYWLVPLAIGAPIMIRAMIRHAGEEPS